MPNRAATNIEIAIKIMTNAFRSKSGILSQIKINLMKLYNRQNMAIEAIISNAILKGKSIICISLYYIVYMNFKAWHHSITEGTRTPYKLGLYPDLYDFVGQYPPLYATPISADFIFYYNAYYGPKGVESKDGLVWYKPMHTANDPHKTPL